LPDALFKETGGRKQPSPFSPLLSGGVTLARAGGSGFSNTDVIAPESSAGWDVAITASPVQVTRNRRTAVCFAIRAGRTVGIHVFHSVSAAPAVLQLEFEGRSEMVTNSDRANVPIFARPNIQIYDAHGSRIVLMRSCERYSRWGPFGSCIYREFRCVNLWAMFSASSRVTGKPRIWSTRTACARFSI